MMTKDDLKNYENRLSKGEKDALAEMIASMDTIITKFNEMKSAVAALTKTADDALLLAKNNGQAAIDLTQAMKNIQIALNAHRDSLPDELVKMADELGKFVLSGPAIQAGVIANENAQG